MAIRVNMQNRIVTAGRFDPIEGDSISLRQKLSRLSSVVSSSNLGAQISGIQRITSDMRVTVAEKPLLKEEWEHIKNSFNLMASTVEDMGLESTEQYNSFVSAYEALGKVMEDIFADMTKDTVLTQDIQVLISAYNQAATSLNNFITGASNSLLRELSKYSLDIEAPLMIDPNGSMTVTAIVRYFDDDTGLDAELPDDMKEQYEVNGAYPQLYIWDIKGTTNDDAINALSRGKRSITIKASEFAGENISVSFSSVIRL